MSEPKTAAILITGATGNIGRELTRYLSSGKIPFRAMVRSMDSAKEIADLPGAEVVEGDFTNAMSVKKALKGIDKVFLLTNSSEHAEKLQRDFVEIAAESGVRHIVKLSQWAADAASPVRFLRYHAAVEQAILNSGMTYTFLRPNLFMQGLLGFRETIVHQGKFFGALGESKISIVDVRDVAAAAGEALVNPGHENKIYNLTGPEALSHAEIAEKLSAAIGREISFQNVPSDMLRAFLLKVGFPEWQADGLVEDYAHYKLGEASEVATGVAEATGKQPRNFEQFANDYASVFS